MKIWPPFVLISLRKEHFYGNAAAELRALFKRVKWCMLWPKMHSLSLNLKIVSLYVVLVFWTITYLVLSKILRQLPSEMALVLCPRVKVLLHFIEVPSMNWFIGVFFHAQISSYFTYITFICGRHVWWLFWLNGKFPKRVLQKYFLKKFFTVKHTYSNMS